MHKKDSRKKENFSKDIDRESNINRKEKKAFPIGFFVLIIYLTILTIYPIFVVNEHIQFGPYIFSSSIAYAFAIIKIIIFIIMIIGLVTRKEWGRRLIIGAFFILIAMIVVNSIFAIINPYMYNSYLPDDLKLDAAPMNKSIFIIGFLISVIPEIIVNSLIIIYAYRSKKHFS